MTSLPDPINLIESTTPFDYYSYYDYEASTTEFWNSENPMDIAEIITKRVLFTAQTWLLRVIVMLMLMMVVTFLLIVPLTVTVIIWINKIRNVILRKRKYLENEDFLKLIVAERVSKYVKAKMRADRENDDRALERAMKMMKKMEKT